MSILCQFEPQNLIRSIEHFENLLKNNKAEQTSCKIKILKLFSWPCAYRFDRKKFSEEQKRIVTFFFEHQRWLEAHPFLLERIQKVSQHDIFQLSIKNNEDRELIAKLNTLVPKRMLAPNYPIRTVLQMGTIEEIMHSLRNNDVFNEFIELLECDLELRRKCLPFFNKAKVELFNEYDSSYRAILLGMMYRWGLGVEKNPKKAVEYFLQAANCSHKKSWAYLSEYYETGKGVEKRTEGALLCLRHGQLRNDKKANANAGFVDDFFFRFILFCSLFDEVTGKDPLTWEEIFSDTNTHCQPAVLAMKVLSACCFAPIKGREKELLQMANRACSLDDESYFGYFSAVCVLIKLDRIDDAKKAFRTMKEKGLVTGEIFAFFKNTQIDAN